jgi:para-nitrobenzyl esterase
LVWLPGGGHTLGAGARRYHDGTAFARDGVVLVSINYRLGALGFFAHPALTREAAADDPLGDFLLMDQIAALRWVKANIHAFGGDPSNVTVFGESAGGVDVVDLLTIASAEGLSQKAIVESAGFAAHSITLAEAEALGGRIAAAAGMHESPITAARLRAIPVADLVKAADEADGPIVDGRLLAARPIARIAAGSLLHVPLMIGTNSDEGSLAGESLPPGDVLKGFSAAEVAALRAAYGGTTDDRALARAVFRDANFAAPSRWIADRASAAAPVFLYRFSYLRRSQRGGLVPGAGHGAEIPYVFDSWRQSPSGGARLPAEDRAEAARVHALWVAFAKTGTPAAPDVPEWPRYSASSDRLLDLGVTATIEPVPDRAAVTLLEKRVIGVDR